MHYLMLISKKTFTLICYAISYKNTKYVDNSAFCLKYTLLLYIQEEDQK